MLLRRFLALIRPRMRRDLLAQLVKCDRTARLIHVDRLELGRYIYIGPNCMINAQGGVRIGDGTILGPEVVILSSTHDYKKGALLPYDIYDEQRPVEIGKGVWLGYRATICPGIRIGDGAIVAMGAVVTKDVEPGQVVGGNPARQLAQRDREQIARMVAAEDFFHKTNWSGPRRRVEGSKS